ncbi:MAG: FAD-dependent oxidoreductase, partial [Mariprofundaceae bacterium]|nr:FAD-dependent oxidoreductase [Mariprofundaceae bacterium]
NTSYIVANIQHPCTSASLFLFKPFKGRLSPMLIRLTNIPVELGESDTYLRLRIAKLLQLSSHAITDVSIVRRAIDARKRSAVHFVCSIECKTTETPILPPQAKIIDTSSLIIDKPEALNGSKTDQHTIIIGAGPAGLFAALALAEAGMRVTLLERGQPVEKRMRDIGRLRSRGELNPESNVCFGEGGAGTYTDGKLYTRIKHPFVRWVLAEFIRFGADENILSDAHPHLGTDKLVRIIRRMREHLLELGVDYRFNARVDHILTHKQKANGVRLANNEEIMGNHIVLAIGHSARDTIENLHTQGIEIEAKDFAVGVRAEHNQTWVNACQFSQFSEHPALSAAEYKLTHQVNDPYLGKRGVYSFCMCPGGLIVPSPTEAGMMAVNGMSNAHRRSPLANSGVVVQVTPDDIKRHGLGNDALCGIRLQRQLERDCFNMTQTPYAAPAMRITDFITKNATGKLAQTRFKPAVEAADLHDLFPKWLAEPLREGLIAFDKKMKGYVSDDANLLAVESRTSSPIRMVRDQAMQSVSLSNLYPIGEGAGYAGGITSAAVDGLKVAAQILKL